VALRETQLRKLVENMDSFVHSSALATAAWLAQMDALIFPQRCVLINMNFKALHHHRLIIDAPSSVTLGVCMPLCAEGLLAVCSKAVAVMHS